jgi:GntR family transcriptional repressor for pyruvate dehydrogenase complex
MNVSRSVVREALMVLSSLDVVESRQGEGTFIKEAISSNFINCNLFGLLIDKEIYLSLFEVRKSIESAIVAKAVERAAEDDFKNFSNNIILLNKHLNANNYLNFITADMGFHKMIAKATHDDILIDLSTNTTGLFMKFWTKMAAISSDDKFNSFRGNVLNQHSNIYKQIQKRNKEEAIKAMEEHMLHEHQAIALGLQELSQNSMPMSWGTVLK